LGKIRGEAKQKVKLLKWKVPMSKGLEFYRISVDKPWIKFGGFFLQIGPNGKGPKPP